MDEDLNDKLPERISGALRKLDRDALQRAQAVDPTKVAARVLARLKDEPATPIRARRWNLTVLRIAAALALLVIGGAVARRLIVRPAGPDSMQIAAADSVALAAAIEDARAAADGSGLTTTVTVEDLDVQELESLLATMNREDAL